MEGRPRRQTSRLYYPVLFLTLMVLFSIPHEKCQGQGCPGEYYERVWLCMNKQKDYCYSEYSTCSNCDIYKPCVGKGDVNYQITACTYVCPTPPDSLTVAGLIVCSASGVEGWCRGSATLNLTATDTLNHAVAFTGSGVAGFPCTAPCAISLPQGQGSVSFTGTCTGGLTAAGGPLPWKLDLTNPTITSASLSGGTAGGGGWYRAGPVNLNCSATDALSGVRGIAYNPQTATANGTTTLRCTAPGRSI
jgi:hypothetical protein